LVKYYKKSPTGAHSLKQTRRSRDLPRCFDWGV
jgi:hypothetical protein